MDAFSRERLDDGRAGDVPTLFSNRLGQVLISLRFILRAGL